MKLCARCYSDTIAVCAGCGAGLCYKCSSKPCALCGALQPAPTHAPIVPPVRAAAPQVQRRRSTRSPRTPAARNPRTPRTSASKNTTPTGYQPRYPRPAPAHKPFANMSPQEGADYCEQKKKWLIEKQRREQSYLMKRQGRNVFTPTDEAYEKDQPEEDDLLAFLEFMITTGRGKSSGIP